MNLLSMSQHQEQQKDAVQEIVNNIYQVLGYSAQDAASSARALFNIVEAAVGLSQTLRKQRPYWLIRLPEVEVSRPVGKVYPAKYDTDEMLDRKFDEHDIRGQGSAGVKMDGYVYFFLTPALLKRGKGNGQQFDEKELVYRKAKVRVDRVSNDRSTAYQACEAGM